MMSTTEPTMCGLEPVCSRGPPSRRDLFLGLVALVAALHLASEAPNRASR